MNQSIIVLRDRGLNNLQEGKTKYLESLDYYLKQHAYEIFKGGIKLLLQYVKREQSQILKDLTKQKIVIYLDEASAMNNYLAQLQQHNEQQKNKPERKNEYTGRIQCIQKASVSFDDLAGMDTAKQILKECILLPQRFPELFQGVRKPWTGILLYGPPGTGKTYLAQACASLSQCSFISISAADVMSKFVGDSERLIKETFVFARQMKPCIIFIDEIDSMLGLRGEGEQDSSRRVKTEFLVQMQGLNNLNEGVIVLGATNTPWILDPAIRRRFEKRVYIPLPDVETRAKMIELQLKDTPHEKIDFKQIAEQLDNFSASDIHTLVRDAAFEPLRIAQRATYFKTTQQANGKKITVPCSPSDPEGEEKNLSDVIPSELYLNCLEQLHFYDVLQRCKPTVCLKDLQKYENWTKEFGVQ